MEKVFLISLKLDFTPNTMGCYEFQIYSETESQKLLSPKSNRKLVKN